MDHFGRTVHGMVRQDGAVAVPKQALLGAWGPGDGKNPTKIWRNGGSEREMILPSGYVKTAIESCH